MFLILEHDSSSTCYGYGWDCLCNYKLRCFASLQKLFIRDNNANLLLCVHVYGICSHNDPTFTQNETMAGYFGVSNNKITENILLRECRY